MPKRSACCFGSTKDMKKFCAVPARFQSFDGSRDVRTVRCGECALVQLVRSARAFATKAVLAHNAECLRIHTEYVQSEMLKAKQDIVDDALENFGEVRTVDDVLDTEVDVHELLQDAPRPEFLHQDMDTLHSLLEDLGAMHGTEEGDEDDATFDEEEVLDVIDDIDYHDWEYEEIRDVFRHYGVPLVPMRVSFAAGGGIAQHLSRSGHDADLGRSGA